MKEASTPDHIPCCSSSSAMIVRAAPREVLPIENGGYGNHYFRAMMLVIVLFLFPAAGSIRAISHMVQQHGIQRMRLLLTLCIECLLTTTTILFARKYLLVLDKEKDVDTYPLRSTCGKSYQICASCHNEFRHRKQKILIPEGWSQLGGSRLDLILTRGKYTNTGVCCRAH